jgi:uncharacterized RDD family membrane protein YckC
MENLDQKTPTTGTLELATAGDRFIAALIDGIIAGVCNIVPFIGWLVGIAYMLTRDALPFLNGQSLGKKVMKIRAVEEATGEPITNKWDKAIIRTISLYIPIFGIVDAFMVLSADRKRFGDKWANTIVVKWPEDQK